MPIEFACDSCDRLLRVPDGSGGGSCTCPVCGTLLAIPEPDAELVQGNQAVAATSGPQASSNLIRVACPKCRLDLVCDKKLLGTKGQCRHCEAVFLISTEPAAAAVASAELIFNCPRCEQLFEGAPEMQGRKGKCHVCGEVFPIELKQAAPKQPKASPNPVVPTRSTDGGGRVSASSIGRKSPGDTARFPSDTSERAPAQRQSDPPRKDPARSSVADSRLPTTEPSTRNETKGQVKPAKLVESRAPIQLKCPDCQGLMEVPGDAAGQLTACPFCSRKLQIPNPPAPEKKTPASRLSGRRQPAGPTKATSGGFDLFAGLGNGSSAASNSSHAAAAEADPFHDAQLPGAPGDDHLQGSLWDDLGDVDAAGDGGLDPLGDPYAGPYAPSAQAAAWSTPTRAKREGLTFSNVFGLAWERAFPMVLLASLVYFGISLLNVGIYYGALFLVGLVLGAIQPSMDVAYNLVFGTMLVMTLVSLCITTAAVSMMCNAALHAMRSRQPDFGELISTGGVFGPMLVYLFLMSLLGAVVGIAPGMLANWADNAVLSLVAALVGFGLILFLGLAFSAAPFAILDGESALQAMSTSAQIFASNFLCFVAVGICTFILFLGLAVGTCGLGAVLLSGLPFFVFAALYHLATS